MNYNKYSTNIERTANNMVEINQFLITQENYLLKIKTLLQLLTTKFNIDNLVFSDTHLAKVAKQWFPYKHTYVESFYHTEYVESTSSLKEFVTDMKDKITVYDGVNGLATLAKKLPKENTAYIINPPFLKTEHIKVFNTCKEFADNVICVHPSTQLQALPNYKNGKDKDYNQYIADGLEAQEILSFTTFTNTRAFGDVIVDWWCKGCTKATQQYTKWDYADRCKDKDLYPIIYDHIVNYIHKFGSIDKVIQPFYKGNKPNEWNVVLATMGCCDGTIIQPNNYEPYDKDGNTELGNKNVWSQYGMGVERGIDKWNNKDKSYNAVGFNTLNEAKEFIKIWTTPEAKVINNCVTHDQNMNTKCLPLILSGDVITILGLNKYRDRIITESRTLTWNKGRYVEDEEIEYKE